MGGDIIPLEAEEEEEEVHIPIAVQMVEGMISTATKIGNLIKEVL